METEAETAYRLEMVRLATAVERRVKVEAETTHRLESDRPAKATKRHQESNQEAHSRQKDKISKV